MQSSALRRIDRKDETDLPLSWLGKPSNGSHTSTPPSPRDICFVTYFTLLLYYVILQVPHLYMPPEA